MPKDEILDGSTWTDVQPQKEEILDGSTWTEVKKKDVPAPKLESGSEATISSNGQSKSTSASTIVSKPNPINQTSFTVSKENNFGIPNFQVQGIQKNTFQPLTEQQKAAGKKVLGEGTPLVEKKKVNIETPETSAKKSAILKAVTGKDISYDEVSRLSDVSNTDYAGILAAQKEKQKTDNTFATNPALQEEQRQEQVKQSEFLGNREFKVNNPQANVQILEQKNPTLLKDIADKTLELDEQRTAESFNKDKPVSQRFSKPKNDVPYKPFTDYLEVEELATVSPMELYETREKESDREKQFKYFKDRGADNVFNEYDNEQTAISFKQGELKKKHETALKNLKAKYGEDINNVEIPQDDKDFVDIIAAQNGLKENYNLSKDLLKTDKYAEVNKTIQERANRQVEIDKTAKDDTWYKFGDEYNKLNNVVMNTAYGLVNDIASLPRFINGLAGENDFNWTDKVADATARFTDAGMAYFNTPTDVQRDNVQDYAEVDGYRVFLDKNGNPTSLRDADNFMVNNDAKKEEIFNKYSENKDKIKVKTDWIDGEQILNQSSKIIGDMLVMIAEGGGIGAGIKGVGKVSRSARILNLAENAKLTTSLAVISQMQNEMMNDAIDKGMSKEDAAKYSAISSAGVAAISLINPMEAQFLKNIKNVKSLASEEVTSFLNGNTTLADLSKKTIGAVIGNSVPEIAEEQFFEPVLQNVVNDSYKNQVGVNEQLDQTDVLGRENLAQSVLTATTTFLPSALESSKNMNSNSIKMNILENPENWMAIIDKKKELGIIEDDVYSAEVAAMNKAKKKYDALKSEVKQSDRTKLAGLIGDKVAIESKLSDAPELKPKYENQVKEIDSKISNLTNGITEAPKIEQAGAINIQSQDFGAEAKQDAKIESAVIEIGGKIYEGKNHAEAILKAKADGQDISQVNRQAEGKFKLSDGTIIDRAESKSRFGQDRSELMIPQDDNAKQANKDYAKITKNNEQQTTTNVEQKSVNNDSSGLSETSKNVESNTTNVESKGLSNESEVPIAEQKVSEEVTATKEETPTALRDVESTAKALENKLPDAYQANTRNQSTKDLIKWAEDIFDTKFEGDFEKGEYVSWFQSLGNEGYEAAGLLNTPKRALLKLKESPTYKGKAVESLLSKEQTPTDVKQKKAESEQGKLSDKDKIQQNAATEVQKQITEVEKIISELEDNPNSPFHKLVNLDEQKQKLSELQKKEAEVKKESAQPVLPETKAQKAANPRLSALPKKKAVPTEKVEEKVDNVEIKKLQEEIDSFDDEYNRLVDAVNKEDRKLNTPKSENEIKLNQLQDKINALIDKRNKLQEQQTPENNQGFQQGDGQNVSNENEVAKVEEKQEEGSGGVVGDVEATAKALDRVEKENPIKIEETEFGGKLTGGIIDVKIKAIQGDRRADVKTPSTLNFLPKVLELVHLARNKKDKGKIISNGFNAKNVSIDSPIAGIYFSSEDWSTMDRFGRSKEDAIYTTIENDGLLYFDSAKGLRYFLKENNLPSEGQTLNAAQMATLKNMGVKGILLREDFASQSRNELIVIDESIIKGISEKPISGITKLPSSFSNTKDIAEAYHKAKADGSNPELVKAVEDALKPTTETNQPVSEVLSEKEQKKKEYKESKQQTPTQQSGEVVSGSVDNPALSDVASADKKTNTVNGYEFTKTPTLDNVIVEPIEKSNNAIIEKRMFADENKNVLADGVKYIGGGWYEIGRDNFGSVDLYNTVTKEGVSLNHKQGGRMGVVIQDFIKNNSRYNDDIAVRGSKYTQEEHNPKFGGSGHYKGTYFYVGLSAESKALEHGKNLTKVDIGKANLYELGEDGQTSQSLKKEAKKAGYDTRDASGYAESEYLKKQGYDGIKRGNEIVLFEPKKFEVKEEIADLPNVSGGTVKQSVPEKGATAAFVSKYNDNPLQMARREKYLDSPVMSNGKQTTERKLIEERVKQGWRVTKITTTDTAASKKLNQEYERLKRTAPIGNENHPETKRLRELEKMPKSLYNEREIAVKKEELRLESPEGTTISITPFGEDYVNELLYKSESLLSKEQPKAEAQSKFVPIPLKGKDLIGDALDRMADKIGSKKNLTQKEKTSLTKDVTDLAKGLIQEGKATLDNVIDKIKEAIKKRFPDLDENDLNDISENIKQKVLFDEAFQWYKDNDYTYEEAKKELDDNDVDYNEKDLKAIFAEKKEKSVNEKRLQNRAFDGTSDEELKSIIEDYGLTYETESQIIAEKEANDIIEEVGLERAFQAVQNGYIKGAQAAVVYAKMVDELDTKLADDKITDEERTRLKELQAYSVDIFDTEARDAGRFLAMLNRLYQKSLFTYDTMVKSATKAKGAPLTSEEKLQLKEQSEKIAEFDKKIKELEAKLDEERAQNAVKNIKALNNKPKTASFKAKAKALADKFRQLKSKPLVLKDADGNPIQLTQNSIVSYNDIIELAAKAIEKTGELLDGINTALQEIKKQKWYQNLSQRDKDAVDRQVKEELLNLDTEVSDDKFKIPNSLLREIVRNGTEDIDGIVEKVLEVYGDIYPELKDDKRKVRDIITKYGETIESKEDLIGDKLALAKRIGRLLSAKDDLLSGKLPKKSGFQREKPGATERLLMQEIQQLLKNVPKSQEELDALWATALDKAKNRVKNRIEELQLAIDKAEKINKSKNVQNYNDAGLDNLKAQLKEKQAEYDAAFPKEKSTLSDEQRLNQLINSKNKRLAKLEQQKIDKVYETNKKEGPDKSKFPELAKQIADLDAEIKKVNDEIKADETWKTHVEKKRIELAKKANQRRIDELKRRIDEKDFITKKNPTPIDDELKQLRREKQKVADDYELAKYKYEQENRSFTQKWIDRILDILTLPKSLKATLDLSAPLRQGATVLLSNPQIFWNSFIKMHGQAISNNIFEKSIDNIKKSDNYDLSQDSGLQITDPNSLDDRKQDDQFSVKLANKIPIFNKLNQGSARAYSGFLNNIRFSLFEQGVKELEAAGYKYEDNPKMFKALASTVNNLTGRGRSADGITGKFLNFILFSPRMITSRVLLLHDLMRTDIPFNSPSRKMAAKSLLGTAVYIGLFNLLGTVISNASGDDDDKDRKPNFNPVATDFLKVRSKQTTFDPTAGYAPLIRTAARIATEKSINSRGRETDLSKAYGSTRYATAFDFFENKLSPTVSYLAAVTTHKNPDNKYESASEAEWYDYITGLVAPLQVMQVAQNFNDKDKFGKDLLEVILGLYGIGVQQYDNTGSGKGDSSGTTSGTDSRGSDSRGTTSGTDSRGSDSRTTAR